jgi:transcriptional regulator with XRE-family HTH domain
MSRVGNALKRERKACGMTTAQVAEQVTLTPQYIRLIECGGAIPSMESTLKLANVFPDVDTAWWLWLLLRDTWGNEVAEVMRRHAIARYLEEDVPPVPADRFLKTDSRGGTA